MDDPLHEQIRALAEQNDLDPDALKSALIADDMPEELRQAMAATLGDISLFAQALSKLDR